MCLGVQYSTFEVSPRTILPFSLSDFLDISFTTKSPRDVSNERAKTHKTQTQKNNRARIYKICYVGLFIALCYDLPSRYHERLLYRIIDHAFGTGDASSTMIPDVV